MEKIHPSNWERHDLKKKPKRQWPIIGPLSCLLSLKWKITNRVKVKKLNTKGLKGPYILLPNHNAFMDYLTMQLAIFPNRANYIVSIDGYLGFNWIIEKAGAIGKRKFTNDIYLIKQLITVKNNKDVIVVYPEARYSLCGTRAVIPSSVAKLAKLLKIPVVTLLNKGHHINEPFWNQKPRGVKVDPAIMKQVLSSDDVQNFSVKEIGRIIRENLEYDDFKWQKDNKIKVTKNDRAEGLHKVLYQCCECEKEYGMKTKGSELFCENCGKRWNMTFYGELEAVSGETRFSHIPDWYEWERKNVRKEIEEERYSLESEVIIDALPNPKVFIEVGTGYVVHDKNGFTLKWNYLGEDYILKRSVASMYSCHIEYDFKTRKKDCFDLSTLEDTYFIYPLSKDFSVTKISLATEELYKYYIGEIEE